MTITTNRAGKIRLSHFRLYDKNTVIKTVWYWHKNRNIDEWKRIEAQRQAHAPVVTQSITKEVRIHNREKTVSAISGAGKNGQLHLKNEIRNSLTLYTKINSKQIKDLNVRPDTFKLLEENKGRTLFDINCRNIFFGSVSQSKEKTINKNKQMGSN